MTRYLLTLLLLLLPWTATGQDVCSPESPCSSRMNVGIVGGSVAAAAGTGCPNATYMWAYDAKYTDHANYSCKADKTTTIAGSEVGTITVDSTNGVTLNAVDEGLNFAIGATEFNHTTGTLWMSVYCSASRSTAVNVFYAQGNGTTNRIHVDVPTTGRVNGYYRGNNIADTIAPATAQGLADTTWSRVLWTWDSSPSAGSQQLKIQVTGKDAHAHSDLTLDDWNGSPADATLILLGEPAGLSVITGTADTCYVKNVFVLAGYDTADPCPDANADGVCD